MSIGISPSYGSWGSNGVSLLTHDVLFRVIVAEQLQAVPPRSIKTGTNQGSVHKLGKVGKTKGTQVDDLIRAGTIAVTHVYSDQASRKACVRLMR